MYCPGPIEELKKLGPGVLKALEELSDWNHHGIVESYYALNAIGDLRDPAAKEFLIKKYKEAKSVSSSMVCRAGAAMSLSKLGESKYAEELIRDMNQGVYTVSGAGKHSSLGATYLEMGKLDEAETEFKEAKRLDSSEISYTFRLACVYALKGNAKKAVDYLKEVMAKDFVKASKLQRIGYFKKLRTSKEWKEFIEPKLKKEKEQEKKEARENDEKGIVECPRCKKMVSKTAAKCPWCGQEFKK
jgi:tetratricopeptide (TPR) repeat protein